MIGVIDARGWAKEEGSEPHEEVKLWDQNYTFKELNAPFKKVFAISQRITIHAI